MNMATDSLLSLLEERNEELTKLYYPRQHLTGKDLKRAFKADLPVFLDLKVKQDADGQTAASVPVRWCIRPELLDEIRLRGWDNPQVVLTVRAKSSRRVAGRSVDDYTDTDMKIVDLDREMTYVQFSRPGINQICAVIVNVSSKSGARDLVALEKECRQRAHNHLDERGVPQSFHYRSFVLVGGKPLEVDVSKEFFAKEYPAWRKQTVKNIFRTSEVDQCHFRKRFWLVALWVNLLVAIPMFVARFSVFLLGLLMGVRGLKPRAVIDMVNWKPSTVFPPPSSESRSVWVTKKDGSERKPAWVFATLNPFSLAVATVAMFFASMIIPGEQNFLWMVKWAMVALVGLVVLIPLVVVLAELAPHARTNKFSEWRRVRRSRKAAALHAQYLAELEAMVCTTGGGTAELSALPKDKQTVTLRFNDLKTKVCKPFAR